jgi:TonB family protein
VTALRTLALAFAFIAAASAGAQKVEVPRGTRLHWPDLQLVFVPDSSGVYLWASSGAPREPRRVYSGAFDPAELRAWISDARSFLDQKLAATDTGEMRTSNAVNALNRGGRVYMIRRRTSTEWSGERFLVMEQGSRGAPPVVANADDRTIHAILDSLELVVRRAPPFKAVRLVDSAGAIIPFDRPARVKPGQPPLQYPPAARLSNNEGVVIARFVIGVDGRVEMNTVRIMASPGEAFHKTVLDKLRELEFEPARFRGAPVPQLVIMPFDFALIR